MRIRPEGDDFFPCGWIDGPAEGRTCRS